jgi:hypothetical protein
MDNSMPSVSLTESETCPLGDAQAEAPPGRSSLDPAIQDILANARKNERFVTETRRAHLEAQARHKRAHEAWTRVATFKGDRIAQHLGKRPFDCYIELLMDLGKVLKADGWESQLQAVKPGSDAKTLAVAILRHAMSGDTTTVEEMVDGAIYGLWTLGLESGSWLREGLMYEILKISPPPERPSGWEGSYPEAIETAADFAEWIEQEMWLERILPEGRGNRSSTGSRVRNAYRLVDKLGLTGMPPEPEGPFTLPREMTILRNLRRQCLLQKDAVDAEAAPCQKSESAAEGDEKQASTPQPGELTREQLVAQFTAENKEVLIDDAVSATRLSENQIQRTQAWKDHEDRLLDRFLQSNPHCNTTDVQREFGFSPSKTIRMPAWKRHCARREVERSQRPIKTRPLTRDILQSRPDEKSLPQEPNEDARDRIWRWLLENADQGTKGVLHRLTEADREALLDHLLTNAEISALEGGDQENAISLVLAVCQTWLEQHEQEVRNEKRPARRRT